LPAGNKDLPKAFIALWFAVLQSTQFCVLGHQHEIRDIRVIVRGSAAANDSSCDPERQYGASAGSQRSATYFAVNVAVEQ